MHIYVVFNFPTNTGGGYTDRLQHHDATAAAPTLHSGTLTYADVC